MIKAFKSAAAILISAAAILSCKVSVTAHADTVLPDVPIDPSESVLIDGADMLDDEQEQELTENIQETAEYIDMNIMVYVSGTAIRGSDSKTQMFCEELCLDAYGRDDDSVVLYLDLAGHGDTSYAPYDFIYTRNRARFYFSGETDGAEDRISAIFDTMNPYLPRGDEDPYTAIERFISGLKFYYNKGPSSLKYFYVTDTGKYITMTSDGVLKQRDSRPKNWGMAMLIGAVIAFIASIITFFCIKSHYKFKSVPSSLHYLRSENIKYGQRSDMFIRKYQIRTKRESSSGSSGGGGGTSSGGGGGGNHR